MRHFARTLGLAPGRLSNIEGASSITDPTTAAFMLGGLGTDYATAQRIITAPAHNAASDLVDTEHDSHAAIAWHYEQVADRVTVWAPTLIPDLLRTPEHDLALITHQLADTGISDAYTLALPQRLEALTNPRRHYTFLLGDTALRACTPALRKRQIGHLRSLAEQRHITIRVVPARHCPPGLVAHFTLYEQATTAIAVAIHHHYATTYLTNPGTSRRLPPVRQAAQRTRRHHHQRSRRTTRPPSTTTRPQQPHSRTTTDHRHATRSSYAHQLPHPPRHPVRFFVSGGDHHAADSMPGRTSDIGAAAR
ncbi:Scr1 family TA system antitoxin-like transcriptional regulator [Amycolatopsis sp. NBC_00438]|uniref:Scr1 family TA system antitoxin-like transcriptional regulator n=1 Tax=Amycolatopsis sp. NBC_00438 TaxID=2903558 RepID=UPI002E2339CD